MQGEGCTVKREACGVWGEACRVKRVESRVWGVVEPRHEIGEHLLSDGAIGSLGTPGDRKPIEGLTYERGMDPSENAAALLVSFFLFPYVWAIGMTACFITG